jgi:hypothetical protein
VSRNCPKTKHYVGRGPKPTSTLRDDDAIIDLSNDEFDDDALEQLIKNRQGEADIFKDLPLFDHDILNNFIDEWFRDPSLSIDDLQLPIDISVTFQGFITKEFGIVEKVVEQKNKIEHERSFLRSMLRSSASRKSKASRR